MVGTAKNQPKLKTWAINHIYKQHEDIEVYLFESRLFLSLIDRDGFLGLLARLPFITIKLLPLSCV